jgi:hypothetical protein
LGISDKAVACIRAARLLEDKVRLWELNPAEGLLGSREDNEAYAASNSDHSKVAVYFPAASGEDAKREVTLNLLDSTLRYDLCWIDIDRGVFIEGSSKIASGSTINPPAEGNLAAVILGAK